jgi:hypothetical protein
MDYAARRGVARAPPRGGGVAGTAERFQSAESALRRICVCAD